MPNWFDQAKKNNHSSVNIELNGSDLIVYHRTSRQDSLDAICNLGFIAGSGALYGRGIYTTYTLASQLRNAMRGYGGYVLKAKVNIKDFLILDYELAKQVYGQNYTLYDQLKNIFGLDKILNSSENQKTIEDKIEKIKSYSERLENEEFTSEIAFPLTQELSLEQTGVRGIIFTGQNDGNVCVSYREANVLPIEHAWVDGRTWKNPQWEKCPERTQEEINELLKDDEAAQKFVQDRTKLIQMLALFKDGNNTINISKEDYPNIPEAIFNQKILNFLYEDESRIARMNPEIVSELKEAINVGFLIRKIEDEPRIYWKEWQNTSDEVKSQIPFELIIRAWQNFLDKHPGRWEDIPEEIKPLLNFDKEIKYWKKTIDKNQNNWAYVPQDLVEKIKQKFKIDAPNSIDEPEESTNQEPLSKTQEFDIPTASLSWVESQIEKMNNKAAQLGLPPLSLELISQNKTNRTTKLSIVGNVPVLEGWKLIGKVMPVKTEGGTTYNAVQSLSDEKIPEEYETSDPDCEHCNKKRNRKKLYVFKNTDTKVTRDDREYILVGSTCVHLFLSGSDNPDKLMSYAEELQQMFVAFSESNMFANLDEKKIRRKFKKDGIPVEFFLGRVLYLQDRDGFVGRKQARQYGKNATTDVAFKMCLMADFDDEMMQGGSIDASQMTFVNNALKWISTIPVTDEGQNDFLENLRNACDSGIVTKQNAGIISWLPSAYDRHLRTTGYKWQYEKLMGNVGKEIVFSGKIVNQEPTAYNLIEQARNSTQYVQFVATNGKDWITWSGDPKEFSDSNITISGYITGYADIEGTHMTALKEVTNITSDEYLDKNTQVSQEITKFRDQNKQKTIDKPKPDNLVQNKPQPGAGSADSSPYQDGQSFEEDLTILKVTQTKFGNFFVMLKDPNGNILSTFSKSGNWQVGQQVRLRGTISIKGMFNGRPDVKIQNPRLVTPN